MNGKKDLLILLTVQFGYHTDTYMYCKYLDKALFNVSYFCFDMNYPKVFLPDIEVIYIPMNNSRLLSYLNFIVKLRQEIRLKKFHLIFHVHTKFTLLIRFFTLFSPTVFHIRSGDLSENKSVSGLKNIEIPIASFLYSSVSVISDDLALKIRISKKKL